MLGCHKNRNRGEIFHWNSNSRDPVDNWDFHTLEGFLFLLSVVAMGQGNLLNGAQMAKKETDRD